jgi:hypothetical protein
VAGLAAVLAVGGLAGIEVLPSAAAATATVPEKAAAGALPAGKAAAGAVPAAPFVVSVSGVGLGVLANWAPNPASDNVTSYAVTATPAKGSATTSCPAPAPVTVSAPPSDSSAVVGGLCASVVYTIRAVAVNAAGSSAPSAASAPVVPLKAQPPDAPLIVSVTARDTQLLVDWSAPAYDGGDRLTGYLLTATHGSQVVKVRAGAGATSATVTGLTDGTAYALSLTASSKAAASAAVTGTGTPSAEYPPSPPQGLSTVPDNSGGVTVSWQPPADDGGGTTTGYTISYQQQQQSTKGAWSPVPGAPVQTAAEPATATSATVTAFPVSPAFYLFWITASNSDGTGGKATAPAPVSPTTASKPSTVVLSAASVSALASVTATSLVWRDPAPSQVTAVKVGDVVTCQPGGLLAGGMLRAVTAITDNGTTTTLTTAQATFSDAVTNMSLASTAQAGSGTASASGGRAVFVPRAAGVTVHGGTRNGTVGAGATFSLSLKQGPLSVSAQFGLTAQVGMDINVKQGFLGIPDGVSVSASAKAGFSLQGLVKVQGSAGGFNQPLETEIGEIDFPTIVVDAIIPIVINPKLPVFFKVSGGASAGFQASMTVGGAVAWTSDDAGHLDVTNLSKGPTLGGGPIPGLNAVSATVFAGLTTEFSMLVDNVVGPDLAADFGLQATINPVAKTGQPFFDLGPVLTLSVGFHASLFIFQADRNVTLAQISFAHFTIPGPAPPTYTITPANPVVGPGKSVTFHAVRSDGAKQTLTWSLAGNTAGDTITSGGVLTVASPPGRTLTVKVSDPTGAVGQTTVAIGVPSDPPGALTVSQAANRPFTLQLSWTAPASTGGFPISDYRIVTQPQSAVPPPSKSTHATLTGLGPGLYAIDVYAINSIGLVSPPATVGAYLYPSGGYSPPGSVWTASQAPLTVGTPSSQALQFYAMACGAAGSCAALGFYVDPKGTVHGTLDTLANGTWTSTVAPLPAHAASDRQSTLDEVACPAAGSCIVVGDYIDSNGNYRPLIDTLANGTWTAAKGPLPAGGVPSGIFGTGVRAVACPAPGTCTAVGSYTDASGNLRGLIETLSGGTWTAAKAPAPAKAASNPEVSLGAMACPAAGSCTAVGSYRDASGNSRPLIETLSGATWAATKAPVPANAVSGAGLGGVACPAVGSCTAVGEYADASQNDHGVLETLSGGTWAATEAPEPADAVNSAVVVFDAVACPAVGSCTALGVYIGFDAVERGVFETLSKGTWTAADAPLPANGTGSSIAFAQNNGASALACPAVGSCVAAAGYTDASGHLQGVLETLTSGTWTATEAPVPANSASKPAASLSSVACPQGGSCTAIGTYTDNNGNDQGLVETQL